MQDVCWVAKICPLLWASPVLYSSWISWTLACCIVICWHESTVCLCHKAWALSTLDVESRLCQALPWFVILDKLCPLWGPQYPHLRSENARLDPWWNSSMGRGGGHGTGILLPQLSLSPHILATEEFYNHMECGLKITGSSVPSDCPELQNPYSPTLAPHFLWKEIIFMPKSGA